jgi:hypothetical protein
LKSLNLSVDQLQIFVKNVIASMTKMQPLWDMILNGEAKKPAPKSGGLSSLLS